MSFFSDLSTFTKQYNDNFHKVRRGSALKLFSIVVIATPVDKGTLRNNWFVGIKRPTRERTNEAASTGQIMQRFNNDLNAPLKLSDPIFLSNNLPYAEAIEYGWSRQAPNGMVRIASNQWPEIVAEMARRLK